MARIYMVRHGLAAAGWDKDPDPPLSEAGHGQAETVARELAALAGSAAPLALLTSPMLRCRETAAPLAALWDRAPVVEPGVTELPSPIDEVAARGRWLRRVMQGSWADLEADPESGHSSTFRDWKETVISTLLNTQTDTVVYSHFIALNVAVGHATDDERVVCFRPDHCSVTIFQTDGATLRLESLGREAQTKVN